MSRDPDLDQALVDLRPVFAALRIAKQQLKDPEVSSNLANEAAVRGQIADLRSRIETRASRIAVEPDALTMILSTDAALKRQLKRRPSAKQLERAIRDQVAETPAQVERAKQTLIEAQGALAVAERACRAARAASVAFTGYGS